METVIKGRVYGEIKRFDGGIINDPRDPRSNVARMVTNFDILSSPRKMTPYRSSESGDNAGVSASKKQNFCIARRTGSTYSVYALGIQSAQTSRHEILYKDINPSGVGSLADAAWLNTGNHQAAEGTTPSFLLFVFYRYTAVASSRIFFAAKTPTYPSGRIFSYDPTGSAVFDDAGQTIAFTTVAQGLVHSKDDILYIPYDNKIAKNNNGVWTNAALTLPEDCYITSICEYNNYLAIAVSSLGTGTNSNYKVGDSWIYLWDRNTSLATIDESIDWGSGVLNILEEVDGVLVGISTFSSVIEGRITFRYLLGNRAQKFIELQAGSATAVVLSQAKQKVNSRLFFMLSILLNGTARDGVWSIGRSSSSEPFVLIHERTPNNDTALSNRTLDSFIITNDIMFIAYSINNGDYYVSKTDDSATFNQTSIYESKIFDGGDSSLQKDLMGVTLTTEFLPQGSVTLKYRTDQNTTFTTIFTNATLNSISYSVSRQSGLLPSQYKEIQFRIESTGQPEITGLSWEAEITGKRSY